MDRSVQTFEQLNRSYKLQLFKTIKRALFGAESSELKNLVTRIIEVRFNQGLICIHCKSKNYKGKASYRDRHRYFCNGCKKSLNDITNSSLSATWHPERLIDYFELMVQGKNFTECSEKLNIDISTSFYLRHKILTALSSNDFNYLSGIVEADETLYFESHKGTKNIDSCKPRKRGGKTKKRSLNEKQLSVLIGIDRKGNIINKFRAMLLYSHVNPVKLSVNDFRQCMGAA